ncbi:MULTISPECIES: hypothetical protein [unclassified Caballeronia]|jgi:hypothetical protein|uniref:hypothetical protein n=1 Tax=unclassified Caballeronia TaxID=2646786 RepID=UPI0020296DD4|nr:MULTISPECIES: hypothetical protein [unclassified Caballeronia]
MKRRKFIALTVSMPFALSGCLTSGLNEEAKSPDYYRYAETISSVLISADQKTLVFLGKNYHYIFDAPDHFVDVLQSPFHAGMTADVNQFYVDGDSNVSGSFVLNLDKAASFSEEQKEELGNLGIDPQRRSLSFRLSGRRYDAKGFDRSKVNPMLLNQSYEVSVREQHYSNAKKVILLATPVTVAADGALMILAIPLLPVLYVVFMRNFRVM